MAITTGEVARAAFERALLVDDPEALYEQAPCGYLTLDADGRLLKANRTFLTWTGFRADDLLATTWFSELLTTGSRIFYETHVRPMLHMKGQISEIALDIVRADGSRLPVLLNAVMEHTEDGVPALTRMAVFDATERRRYEQELLAQKKRAEESEQRLALVARTLQETLMPPRDPRIRGLDVATGYRPAGSGDEIGGDFYDVFEVGDGSWVVAIGDVAGKGVEAAVVATLARHTIRALAATESSPARTLEHLNHVVLAHPSGRFLTAALLRLRRANDVWSVTMALGGHPPAILVGERTDPVRVGDAAHLVGAFDFAEYDDLQFELAPGTTLLLHTDGVTEASAPGRRGSFYGEARLLRVVHGGHAGARDLVDRILTDVMHFQANRARDDIALVALRVPAPGR